MSFTVMLTTTWPLEHRIKIISVLEFFLEVILTEHGNNFHLSLTILPYSNY